MFLMEPGSMRNTLVEDEKRRKFPSPDIDSVDVLETLSLEIRYYSKQGFKITRSRTKNHKNGMEIGERSLHIENNPIPVK